MLGEGPCHEAFLTGTAITARVDDQPAPRWPEFVRFAWQNLGELTVHAFPMQPGGEIFGVLSFYFARGAELLEPVETAQFVADAVGAALLRDPVPNRPDPGRPDRWSARAKVHQATGMVIAQLHLSPEDALAILRAHAYAQETTLADIAHQVLSRTLDFRRES